MRFSFECGHERDINTIFTQIQEKQYDDEKLRDMHVQSIDRVSENTYIYHMSPSFYDGWLNVVLPFVHPYLCIRNHSLFHMDQKIIEVKLTGVDFTFHSSFVLNFQRNVIEIDDHSIRIPRRFLMFRALFLQHFIPRLVATIRTEVCKS